jgi:hypothetical protein
MNRKGVVVPFASGGGDDARVILFDFAQGGLSLRLKNGYLGMPPTRMQEFVPRVTKSYKSASSPPGSRQFPKIP